jgi:sigma-B regulation protein RsbU (phosphoserine phosphatase)
VLRNLIERALVTIPREQREAIYERWINLELEQPLLGRRLLIPALIVLGALLASWIGIVAWNRLLRRQVALRTAELQRHRDHLEEIVAERTAQLTEANQQFSRQIDLAHGVLRRFLPTDLPQNERFAFGTLYLACEAVGGDMYDIFEIDEEHIGLFIADVSGHGISAALLGATLKMSVEAMKHSPGISHGGGAAVLRRPRDMLLRLNGILCENLAPNEFITVVCAIISGKTGEVRLCNAGHNPPVQWRAAVGRAEMVRVDSGLPLGPCREEDLIEQRIKLQPGDRLVFYTDGLTESHAGNPEHLFGEERLIRAVTAHAGEEVQQMIHRIKEEIDEFAKGHPSADDVAIIAVEMASPAGAPPQPS